MPDFKISLVTTLPAPITTLSQTVTGNNVEFEPIKTLFPTSVGCQFFFDPPVFQFLNKSFTNITPCPIKQSSPILTNSHINV